MNKQDKGGSEREERLYDIFNKAVGHFHDAATNYAQKLDCLEARNHLMDCADEVLLARDELQGATLNSHRWDNIVTDVADVAEIMEKAGIGLLSRPVETSTGRKTYRILNKPRFDA